MDLIIHPSGTISTLYSELLDLSALGAMNIARASQVEPDETGRWFADVIDGPRLGPFERRSDALAAEVEWLTRNRLLRSPDTGLREGGHSSTCPIEPEGLEARRRAVSTPHSV